MVGFTPTKTSEGNKGYQPDSYIHISTSCLWPYRVRTEACCAVVALFPPRSSLKWATGESKWVLTRSRPPACSAKPQLARQSQQWANSHLSSLNHFDFSVLDPTASSYDLQAFRETTVACLDRVSWRDQEVVLFLSSFQCGESSLSLMTLLLNFNFKLSREKPQYFF